MTGIFSFSNCIKSQSLHKLHRSLLSIQPPSTNSERVFSMANSFATKNRNRMKGETLSWITFLKFVFTNYELGH